MDGYGLSGLMITYWYQSKQTKSIIRQRNVSLASSTLIFLNMFAFSLMYKRCCILAFYSPKSIQMSWIVVKDIVSPCNKAKRTMNMKCPSIAWWDILVIEVIYQHSFSFSFCIKLSCSGALDYYSQHSDHIESFLSIPYLIAKTERHFECLLV